jgi:hypothetical protein
MRQSAAQLLTLATLADQRARIARADAADVDIHPMARRMFAVLADRDACRARAYTRAALRAVRSGR